MRFILITVFTITVNNLVFSSERIRHFTEKNGLSSRDIHHCLTDSRGFIWVATANGLNRFDGYKFWQPGKELLKLSSTRITWLLEDNNTLWIGTDNGINLLNLSNYHLTGIFNHTNEAGTLSDNYITGIYKTFDNSIWVTTGEGMLHKYLGKGKFQQIKNPEIVNGSFGVRIFFTEDSLAYWVRSENTGTYRIDKKSNNIHYYSLTSGNHIGGIRFISGKGTLDFRKEGVFKYDETTKKFNPYLTQIGKDVYDILPDMNNNLWIISGDSRKISCLSGTEFSDKSNQLFPPPYIVHIRNMVPGPVSSIWICTNNGLYQISNDKELFTSILKQNEVAERDYIPSFRGMIQDKNGQVFIGGYGGFFSMESEDKINRLPVKLKPYNPFVLIDEDNNFFWAVTEGYGLVKINKKSAVATICYQKHITPEDHSYRYLTAGVKDIDGTLILGGYEGLFNYDPKTDRLNEFNISFGNKNLGEMTIKHLIITSNGYLWISTQNGLFVLDKNRKPLWHFHKDAEDKLRLLSNMVICVLEAKNHTIWIATKGGGIRVFNYKSPTPIFYNTSNGLSDDNVVSIQEDLHQRIWAGSDFGLSVIKPESGKVISYFAEDGLADNEFNAGSSLRLNSGLLLFGGVNGITICNPETNLNPINKSQFIQFSRMELINNDGDVYKEYNPDIIQNGISLSYTNRFFELEFFITEFLLSEKNSYQYKLEGYDNRWIPIGEQNNIRFAALPAGDFKLHIKGTGFRGTSTLNEITIPITVHAAFYNTIWFYISCIVVIGLIIYLILFQKIRRLRYMNALRSKLSSNLHDDVGSVLTRIAMQAELLQDEENPESRKVLNSIINSCRTALSNMRDLVWSMDNRQRTTGNLFDKVTELSRQMFDETGYTMELNINSSLYSIPMQQKTREELYFIIKEAFHNILKYGTTEGSSFTATTENKGISINIKNKINSGRKKNNSGYGLHSMNKRAEKIKADIQFTDNKEIFSIEINLGFRNFPPFKKSL